MLLEKDIEDIIYNSPWLLDERFNIPKIKGSRGEVGRQINIGRGGLNRYIDLLFRDSRDNRPVIVELKKDKLTRDNIAQILEYRALILSMDRENKIGWEREFGQNYYCPKLILIGSYASDEVRISANLAGIEIRTLKGVEELEVDFGNIKYIQRELNNWTDFLNSGNRTLQERETWIDEIYSYIKEAAEQRVEKGINIPQNIYRTSYRDSWIENIPFPFINIPVFREDKPIGGFYEYYDHKTQFSEEYIYFDFLVEKIHFSENTEDLESVRADVIEYLFSNEYNIIACEEGIVSVRISREILSNRDDMFKKCVNDLIYDSVYINDNL